QPRVWRSAGRAARPPGSERSSRSHRLSTCALHPLADVQIPAQIRTYLLIKIESLACRFKRLASQGPSEVSVAQESLDTIGQFFNIASAHQKPGSRVVHLFWYSSNRGCHDRDTT